VQRKNKDQGHLIVSIGFCGISSLPLVAPVFHSPIDTIIFCHVNALRRREESAVYNLSPLRCSPLYGKKPSNTKECSSAKKSAIKNQFSVIGGCLFVGYYSVF